MDLVILLCRGSLLQGIRDGIPLSFSWLNVAIAYSPHNGQDNPQKRKPPLLMSGQKWAFDKEKITTPFMASLCGASFNPFPSFSLMQCLLFQPY
ncbi:hypothetical protein CEXT_598021 [Caerostris extrusa]|uniref:Uncharacterized protein n=1 Tax=Caerostris extrusa TaxID=172846 RepID=A0AAV4NTD9_CAEEX|nr:hypothetical protein CEXT_598021 [Caerostris extrusa]